MLNLCRAPGARGAALYILLMLKAEEISTYSGILPALLSPFF